MRHALATFVKGFVIGLANVIPGVSGGTMALVLGIYDRLITAGSRVGVATAGELRRVIAGPLRRDALVSFARKYDVAFNGFLVAGALTAIVAASRLLLWLLFEHPDPTYGFFFGLVAASVVVPWSLMRRRAAPELACAIAAAALTVAISTAMSGEERVEKEREKLAAPAVVDPRPSAVVAGLPSGTFDAASTSVPSPVASLDEPADHSGLHLGFLFAAGALASAAMILPGVSGSFLLLLLGAYEEVLGAVSRPDLVVIAVFGTGCALGLILFVKFLGLLLARFHDQTMGFLAGLMVGSLWSLWPFQERVEVGDKSFGVGHLLPRALDATIAFTVAATLFGAGLVLTFHLYERRRKRCVVTAARSAAGDDGGDGGTDDSGDAGAKAVPDTTVQSIGR